MPRDFWKWGRFCVLCGLCTGIFFADEGFPCFFFPSIFCGSCHFQLGFGFASRCVAERFWEIHLRFGHPSLLYLFVNSFQDLIVYSRWVGIFLVNFIDWFCFLCWVCFVVENYHSFKLLSFVICIFCLIWSEEMGAFVLLKRG